MYVLNHDRQISLIREMTQLRRDNERWEVYYHHPTTNAMWKSYFPKANEQGRGPKILRTEPVPESLEERLEHCLVEPEAENAIGLGIELSTNPALWNPVIEIVENKYRQYHRKQLSLFLDHLGIEDYKSLFSELEYDVQSFSFTKGDLDKLAKRSKVVRFKRFWFF